MKRSLTALLCSLITLSAGASPNWTPVTTADYSQLRPFMSPGDALDRNARDGGAKGRIQRADEVCCPAGYPWYRQSANTCWSSYSDCHDTNGGGWYCREVNQC